MHEVVIEQNIFETLKFLYFGSTDNCYKASSKKAYLDLCRTIIFNGAASINRKECENAVDLLIEDEISNIVQSGVSSQEKYNEWHSKLCNKIIKIYTAKNIEFHFGQAQKWINMTVKYLYVINDIDFSKIINYAHIPLDNYVFKAAEKELGIKQPIKAWSRMDKQEYKSYQCELREAIINNNKSPLKWEMIYWLKEAKINSVE